MPGRCAGARQCISPMFHLDTFYGFPSTSVLGLWQVFCKVPWQQALLLGQGGCKDRGRLCWLS